MAILAIRTLRAAILNIISLGGNYGTFKDTVYGELKGLTYADIRG